MLLPRGAGCFSLGIICPRPGDERKDIERIVKYSRGNPYWSLLLRCTSDLACPCPSAEFEFLIRDELRNCRSCWRASMRQVKDVLTSIAKQTMVALVTPCDDLARSCPSAGVSNRKVRWQHLLIVRSFWRVT